MQNVRLKGEKNEEEEEVEFTQQFKARFCVPKIYVFLCQGVFRSLNIKH